MATQKSKSPRNSKPGSSRIHAPGYGFPKGKSGLLPWAWAEQRLKKSHNYWITTVSADPKQPPKPHTMVIWALWQDGRILFSTGGKSQKARNLANNPHCILCNEAAHEAVIVEGTVESASLDARRKFLPAYERKYKFDMSAMKDDILSMKEPVFSVKPQLVFGLWEKHFQKRSTRWIFR